MAKHKKAIIFGMLIIVAASILYFLSTVIPFGNGINDYIYKIALNLKTPVICNLVFLGEWNYDYGTSGSEARYWCKVKVAGTLGDINFCLSMEKQDKTDRTAWKSFNCFQIMADQATSLEFCNKLPTSISTHPTSPRYMCVSSVALKKSDPSICNIVPESGYESGYFGSKKVCLINIGKKLGKPNICDLLSQTTQKSDCYNQVANNRF